MLSMIVMNKRHGNISTKIIFIGYERNGKSIKLTRERNYIFITRGMLTYRLT